MSIIQLISNFKSHLEQGEIWYHKEGEQIALHKLSDTDMQAFRAKEIAMIFQEPMTALNPSMRCGKQIYELINQHLKLSKEDSIKKCLDLFESVELPNPERIYKSYPHQLSGGQKQRVMIAMALACDPKLLIADEPTTALDVTVQKEVLQIIKQLQLKHQMACLFISHDLGLVKQVADKIVVMQEGKVVECKPTKDLFNNAEHPYTKALLACKPDINKQLKNLPTVSDFMREGFDIEAFYSKNKLKGQGIDYRKAKTILDIKGLSKTYKSSSFLGSKQFVKAVDDVSFQLFRGESLGIVGESGCGKSTISKCIIQLEKHHSGSIEYLGKRVETLLQNDPMAYRKAIQMIFQDPASALNPKMRIGKSIEEVMQVHGIGKSVSERKEKVIELLKNVGLNESHYQRYPHEFSGGQKQRIGIARALAVEPKIIICDESVSALDVSVQAQVLNLLNELKERYRLSYIFISHDLSVVKHFCDRIIVLNKGKVEEEAHSKLLFDKPQSAYTKKLIDAIPR